MKVKLISLMFFSVVLTTLVFADEKLPSWVLQPTRDSGTELFGVGEGTTVESATNSALNAVAANLLVSVSSTFINRESVSVRGLQKDFRKDVENEVHASVEDIHFGKYKTTESYQDGSKKYVMVSVDRRHFTEETLKDYRDILVRFGEVGAGAGGKSVLQNYLAFKENEALLPKAKRLGSILRVLGEPTDEDSIKAFEKIKPALVQRIKIAVVSDQDDVRPAVEKYFNSMSLKVVRPKEIKDRKDVVFIRVDSDSVRSEIYNTKMVRITVSMQILDDSETLFNSYQIEGKGASVLGYDQAFQAAIKDFQKNLRKTSPLQLLGLKD